MTSVIKDTRIGTFNFIAPEAIQDLSGGGEVYPREKGDNGLFITLLLVL